MGKTAGYNSLWYNAGNGAAGTGQLNEASNKQTGSTRIGRKAGSKYVESLSNPALEDVTLLRNIILQFSAKKSDIKQIEQTAKQFNMSPI